MHDELTDFIPSDLDPRELEILKHRSKALGPLHNVSKRWGEEIWICNDTELCGKEIIVEPGSHTSYHFHEKKKEYFYVIQGEMLLYVGTKEKIEEIVYLENGSRYYIPKGVCHCIRNIGVEDLHFIEVSTHHEDSDSYRVLFP